MNGQEITPAEIMDVLAARVGAGEGARVFTDRTIPHEEALAAAYRLINSHFNNPGEHARTSVPADRDRDDDLVLCAYIAQRRATDVPWLSYDLASNVLTIDGFRVSRTFLDQITTAPCGVRFSIMSREDGAIVVRYERNAIEAAAPTLLSAAKEVMELLDSGGAAIIPHLLFSEQSAGRRLREAIADAERDAPTASPNNDCPGDRTEGPASAAPRDTSLASGT